MAQVSHEGAMEPQRFDEWTKALVSGTSRRAFLASVLRAGAAALGLSAISAQTARADDQPKDFRDKCQQRLDRCRQRSSYDKCAKCVAEYEETDCPTFAIEDLSFVELICQCSSDSYCDDGNACTLDICSSNICYNDPIEATCVQCRNNRQCPNGGKCCQGRCCPAGTYCQVNAEGISICCESCTDGTECCQQISRGGDDPNGSRGYVVALGTCVGQEGAAAGLPTFCCGGCAGGYDDPTNPNSGLGCSCPVRRLP